MLYGTYDRVGQLVSYLPPRSRCSTNICGTIVAVLLARQFYCWGQPFADLISFQPRSSILVKKILPNMVYLDDLKRYEYRRTPKHPSIIGKMMIPLGWYPRNQQKTTHIWASDCLGPATGPRGGVGDWPMLATLVHGLCKKLEGPGTTNLTKLLCKKVCFFQIHYPAILPFVWITTCKREDFSRFPFFAFFTFSSSKKNTESKQTTWPSAISRTAISPQKTTKKVISNTSNTSCKRRFPTHHPSVRLNDNNRSSRFREKRYQALAWISPPPIDVCKLHDNYQELP